METMDMDFSVALSKSDHDIQLACRKVLQSPLGLSVQRKIFARLEMMLEINEFGSRWRFRKQTWEFELRAFVLPPPMRGAPCWWLSTKLVYAYNDEGKALSSRDNATLNAVQRELGIGQYGPGRMQNGPAILYHACERLMAVEKTFRRREPIGMLSKR